MNPPTVGGKFAAKDVGGGVPDASGGVKPPPYDAKDKGDTMARLRAGHARPLQSCRSPLRGFGGTSDSKVEEGAGALRTKSNTAFV